MLRKDVMTSFVAAMLVSYSCMAAVNGTDGNISWSVSDSGVLTISGNGAMKKEYTKSGDTTNAPWATYASSITSIVVETGVTTLADRAFRGLSNVTTVSIAPSVTKIGNTVFENNTSLTNITIPNSVTSIGNYAFKNAYSLTDVTIPNSVKSIGDYAFSIEVSKQGTLGVPNEYKYESSLKNVTFEEPSSIETIGTKAFQGQKSLLSLALPDGLTVVRDHAFEDAVSMQSLTIPSSVVSIQEGAFSRAENLTSINFSEGLETIGQKSFAYTYSLENLVIPNSVTSIGNGTFVNAVSLTTLVLGDGLTSIGESAFDNTPSLTSLRVGPNLTSIGKNAFRSAPITELTIDSESSAETLQALANFFKKRTVPASVETINCLGAARSVCDSLMAPYWDIRSIPGRGLSRGGEIKGKRIYTVEEATSLSKPAGNTIKLRFK